MLQMGTDLKRLEDGLSFLQEVASKGMPGKGPGNVELLGSIFLPSKRRGSSAEELLLVLHRVQSLCLRDEH